MSIFLLSEEPVFPDSALADEDGLLAVGGDLSPVRLLVAYSQGIFPWYGPDSPRLWWSPEPRLILEPASVHVPNRLRRIVRQGRFRFTLDTAFEEVIDACARVPRRQGEGTWIVPEMQAAYVRLHRLGMAHSLEVWSGSKLVGGLYGLALGGAFFGESMFRLESDASKAGVVTLIRLLHRAGYVLFDCQQTSEHMVRLGGFEVNREEFRARLHTALSLPCLPGPWHLPTGKHHGVWQ